MIHDNVKLESLIGNKNAELLCGNKHFHLLIESSPKCSQNCPAGINVKSYVNLIANRRYEDALELIRETNPFPGICGRVCTHPCEANCERLNIDEAISIKALKRFVADFEISQKFQKKESYPIVYKENIAIVGGGPAGLTTALDLVKYGYSATVFEAMEKAGGMLAWGIPEFRLPRDVLQRELDIIKSWGVKIETGKRIENPKTLLLKDFDIVVIASGAWKGIPLKINGNNLEGVIDCLEFLQKVNSKELEKIKGKVVVIGGGNSAIDTARTALRLGAEKVVVAYRRTENEMPADAYEVINAKEEGVEIMMLSIPKRIIGKEKVQGIEFLKTKLGEEDESGRRRPVPVEESEVILDCDILIPAIGIVPDLTGFEEIVVNKKGLIKVNKELQTSFNKIYAVGDVVRGPSTIVDVIGDAHLCASFIHNNLRGVKSSEVGKGEIETFGIVIKNELYEKKIRKKISVCSPDTKKSNFIEVEKTYSELAALKESSRCIRCGPCSECRICFPTCDSKQAVALVERDEFLVKLPRELSKDIHNGDERDCQIKVGEIKKKIRFSSLTPVVDKNLCIACGRCEKACAYRAIRICLKAGVNAYSYIEHDVCRSCGRCVFVCPTNAISLELYSESNLWNNLDNSIKKNDGIAVFGCYWGLIEREEIRAVDLMCSIGITPSLIIEALYRGARGVLILHCDSSDEHYLNIEYGTRDIVKDTKEILKIAGINPNRVISSAFSKNSLQNIIRKFKSELDKEDLESYKTIFEEVNKCIRIGREIFQLLKLAEQDGKMITDSFLLKGNVLRAAGLPHSLEMLDNINKLAIRFEISLDIEKLDENKNRSELLYLLTKIADNNHKFQFENTNLRVGIHSHRDDTLLKPIKAILQNIPIVELVELEDMECGASGWCSPNATAREKAINLFKEAENKKIDLIITSSADCLTHLRACNRIGALRYSSVDVKDIYSFLIEILGRGE